MKYSFLISMIFLVFTTIACNNETTEERHDSSTEIEIGKDSASKSAEQLTETYQCPMKCEGDKTYEEKGECSVCGMDTEAIKN